jgi:flagellar assembly protein FliH
MSNPRIEPLSVANARCQISAFRPMLASQGGPIAQVPVSAGDDDPYARGVADGQSLAEAAFAVERDQLLKLIAASQALQAEPSEELAQLIAESVHILVRQIVDDAPISVEWLQAQLGKAAGIIADCDAARTAWLHPDDLALMEQADTALHLMADPAAQRGSIRIDCSAGWIEHGRSIYLDALRSALALEPAA